MINKIRVINSSATAYKNQNTNTDRQILFDKTNTDTFSLNNSQPKNKSNLSFGLSQNELGTRAIIGSAVTGLGMIGTIAIAAFTDISPLVLGAGGAAIATVVGIVAMFEAAYRSCK